MEQTATIQKRPYTRKKKEEPQETFDMGIIPPQAIDLEESVIGALMLEEGSVDRVIDFLKPECFYKEAHVLIYRAILKLRKKSNPIDILTVVNELKVMGEYENVGGAYYITGLTNRVASAANVESHSRIIQQKHIQRELIRVNNKNISNAYEDSTDIFGLLDQQYNELNNITKGITKSSEKGSTRLFSDYVKRLEIIAASSSDVVSGVPTTIRGINKVTNGWQNSDLVIVAGRPACISGSTVLYISRKRDGSGKYYTLKDLYYKFNGIRHSEMSFRFHGWDLSLESKTQCYKSDERLTGLNTIENVIESGIKDTYIVTTDGGKSIRATLDHRFLFSEISDYKQLKELSVGDYVFCKSDKIIKGVNKEKERKFIYKRMPYYPSAKVKKVGKYLFHRIQKSRAVYDANINNVSLEKFIDEVCTNKNHGFIFSDMSMDIHHKDLNPLNDVPDNLELLTKKEHGKIHEDRSRFGLNFIQKEKIVSIEYFGKEMTYDICMKSPYHNFIANKFVVHNSGKTSFIKACIRGAMKELRKPVVIFSLEMSSSQLIGRFISEDVQIPSQAFNSKDFLGQTDFKAINSAIPSYSDANGKDLLLIDDTAGLKINELRVRAKRMHAEHGICMIVIDYLQLINGDSYNNNKTVELEEIAMSLKNLAKELDIPVIALSQLNREVDKRSPPRPVLSDLRSSGGIEQAADVVVFLYRPESYKILELEDGSSTQGYAQAIIAKHRNGALADVDMKFTHHLTKFSDWKDDTPYNNSGYSDSKLTPNTEFSVAKDEWEDSPF